MLPSVQSRPGYDASILAACAPPLGGTARGPLAGAPAGVSLGPLALRPVGQLFTAGPSPANAASTLPKLVPTQGTVPRDTLDSNECFDLSTFGGATSFT